MTRVVQEVIPVSAHDIAIEVAEASRRLVKWPFKRRIEVQTKYFVVLARHTEQCELELKPCVKDFCYREVTGDEFIDLVNTIVKKVGKFTLTKVRDEPYFSIITFSLGELTCLINGKEAKFELVLNFGVLFRKDQKQWYRVLSLGFNTWDEIPITEETLDKILKQVKS